MSLVLARTGSTLSSQVASGKTNIAKLNVLRYTLHVLLTLCIAFVKQKSVLVGRKYAHYIILTGSANVCAASLLYFVASFMPLGNFEAMYLVLYILIATTADFIKGVIKLTQVVRSALAICGIILVSQPWITVKIKPAIDEVPCDYWDHEFSSNITFYPGTVHLNGNHIEGPINGSSMGSSRIFNYSGIVQTGGFQSDSYAIFINGIKHNIKIDPIYLGYLLLFFTALFSTLKSYLTKFITGHEDPVAIAFWLGIWECMMSVVMAVIWAQADGSSLFSMPSGLFCLTFSLLYVLCAAVCYIIFVHAVGYFNISNIATSYVLMLLILYISQRTWLKYFHADHGNWIEVCGITLILACILLPVLLEGTGLCKEKTASAK